MTAPPPSLEVTRDAAASTPRRPPGTTRRRLTGWLAWTGAALMFAIVGLSAYLRLRQAGLGCSPWPACYGAILGPGPTGVVADAATAAARQAHRLAASAMLLLALALGVLTLGPRPRLRREGRLALGVLVLTLALAALGVASRGSTLPAVVLGNLLGGFLTLALCARLAAVANDAAAPSPALRRWLRLALLLVLVQACLGGLVSASFSATSCGSWSECAQAARGADWGWRLLDPWLAPTPDALLPGNPRGAWLQWLHRAGAWVVLGAGLLAAGRALLDRRRLLAVLLAGLLALQLTNGLLLAPDTLSLAQVLVHNLVSALLLALLARNA
ncbi:MAG TPA: COX15/CtaA family protein [Ottowia sp.]|uniref:COX15/CtaA family protein n=1 Tax=Ottowia sp. TaxID=1898956 RepID=UPI002CB345C9|nr:COX15/CtaA family protein [Ottowia sp.]HMN20431.1 COX15/CtaA family protein [Ottowia sp.]